MNLIKRGENMSKISVIVPIYNSSKKLSRCLDSLVNQTYKNLEIILVNDGSTYNSKDIIKEYAKKYPQIKWVSYEENQGQSYARNIGLSMATGEYIGFVDSDDYVELPMYETLNTQALKNDNPDIITTGIRFLDSNQIDQELKIDYPIRRWAKKVDLVKNPDEIYWQSPSVCNKIFKKELIQDMQFINCKMWEDFAFSFGALMKANTLVELSDNLYVYQKDITKGVSSKAYKTTSSLEECFKIADEIENQALLSGNEEKRKEVIKFLQISVCLERLSEIKEWNASQEYKDSKMIELYEKTKERYGNWEDLDTGILSSRCDLFLIQEVKDKIEKKKMNQRRI